MSKPVSVALICSVMLLLADQDVRAQQAVRETRQWYELYDEGVRAVQERQWQTAITNLDAAKVRRAQQSRRVTFYGDRVDTYIPDYYLGLAYIGLGRFADADAAFARVSAGTLITPADRTYTVFQQQSALAKRESALGRAEQFARAGNPTRAQQELKSALDLGATQDRVAAVETLIAAARPVESPPTPAPAARGGQSTPAELSAQTPAELRIDQAAGGGTPAANGNTIQGPPQNSGSPVAQTARLAVPNLAGLNEQSAVARLRQANLSAGRIERSRQATRAVVGTVIGQSPVAGSLVPLGTTINLTLSGVLATARLSEAEAFRSFLSGDYAGAAQTLEAIVAANGNGVAPASPRARLYLASSVAALVLIGDRDRVALEAARQQLAMVGGLPRFQADTRLISPRIWSALGVQQP